MRTNGAGTKAQREQLRRAMQQHGCTIEQVAAEMMLKWGYRPRQAWRHAHGLTQEEVAERYNEIINDPRAPMSSKRIADYEAWPKGGIKPSLTVLRNLARVFGTVEWKLIDYDDRLRLNSHEVAALGPNSHPPADYSDSTSPSRATAVSDHNGDLAPTLLRQLDQLSISPNHYDPVVEPNVCNLNLFIVDPPDELSPRRLQDLVNAVAYQSKSHAENAQEHGMPDILLDDVTAEVEHLTREHLTAGSRVCFAATVQARDKVYRLLERRQYPGQTSHLYYLASVLCALLADTSMSFGMPQASLEQTRAVAAYAEIIGHNSLRLWARMTQAVLAHAAGRPQRALELAESAQEWATEPLGKTSFHVGVARYCAATGRVDEARSALSLAFDAHESATGESELFDVLGGMFSYPAARLFCVSTMANLDLKDGEEAESHAMQALAAYEAVPAGERPQGNILSARIDLAHARLLKGQIDGVVDTLNIALRVPPEQRLDWVVQRLKDFYRTLQGHGVASSPIGRQLAEEIEEFCDLTATDQFPNIGR